MKKKFLFVVLSLIFSLLGTLFIIPTTYNVKVAADSCPLNQHSDVNSGLCVPNVGLTPNTNIICQALPFLNTDSFGLNAICGTANGNNTKKTGNNIKSLVQFGVSLIFVGIILFAVFTIIKAAIKYIQSEGDDTKIQEASKAIKSVFIGIGALFVGVIGIIIVIVFFQGAGAGTALSNNNSDNAPGIKQIFDSNP